MPPVAVSALAAASLVVGFVVAQATGVRALGGVVLVVALAVCARVWQRRAGSRAAGGLVVVYLAAFVALHLLAMAIGAWPSVLTAAVLVAVASQAAGRSDRVPTR
jgi:hypothetical protein